MCIWHKVGVYVAKENYKPCEFTRALPQDLLCWPCFLFACWAPQKIASRLLIGPVCDSLSHINAFSFFLSNLSLRFQVEDAHASMTPNFCWVTDPHQTWTELRCSMDVDLGSCLFPSWARSGFSAFVLIPSTFNPMQLSSHCFLKTLMRQCHSEVGGWLTVSPCCSGTSFWQGREIEAEQEEATFHLHVSNPLQPWASLSLSRIQSMEHVTLHAPRPHMKASKELCAPKKIMRF